MADVTEPTTWNGMVLPWGNRRALQWAFMVGQRLDALKFHAAARLVLQSLALHSSIDREKTNLCFPGVPLIAQETGLHRSHVTQIVKELEAAGIVSVEQVPGKSNRYRLRPEIDGHQWSTRRPARPLVTDDPSSQTTSPLVTDDGYPSSETTPPLVSDDPNTYSEDDQVKTGKGDEQAAAPLPGRSARGQTSGQEINPDDSKRVKRETEPGQPAPVPPVTPKPAPAQPAKKQTLVMHPTGKFAAGQQPAVTTPDQADELASWYYSLIGEPQREANAARTTWSAILRPLIEQYSLETAKAVMTWASESAFWCDKLAYDYTDSARKAVEKFSTWTGQRADEADRASKKPNAQASPSAPAPNPNISRAPIIAPECYLKF